MSSEVVRDVTNEPFPDPASATLARHAVLVGMTPLIPVPVVDDLARAALQRRMVRSLAAEQGVALTEADVEALVGEPGGGCLGFLPRLLLYPLKKIFRKIFFFLEVKRAVDLVSATWHFGWLLQVALRESARAGVPLPAAQARAAIEELLREGSVKPLERAVKEAMRGSRSILQGGADLLGRALRGTSRRAERVEDAVAAALPQEQALLENVVKRLQSVVAAAPREHLLGLGTALRTRLDLSAR